MRADAFDEHVAQIVESVFGEKVIAGEGASSETTGSVCDIDGFCDRVRAALNAAGLSTPGDIADVGSALVFGALERAGLRAFVTADDASTLVQLANARMAMPGNEWMREVRADIGGK
jgi:hypothetical protein